MANLNEIFQTDKKTNEIGVYNLTPVEAFLINKHLPFGTKFILENEYKRMYYIGKKRKCSFKKKINRSSMSSIDIINKEKNNEKLIKNKIPNLKYKNFHLKLIYKGKSHINPVFMIKCKCLIFLSKISNEFELEPFLIYNTPSIRDIESNVMKCKYESFYEFKLSIRNFWLHYFKNEKKSIGQIKKLCNFSEVTFENIEKLKEDSVIKKYNSLLIDEHNSLFQTKTISSNLTIESNSNVNIQAEKKKDLITHSKIKETNSLTTHESLLNDEKNILCEKIKSLTSNQLQGIIPLLSDYFTDINNITDPYVEFDIELLNQNQIEKLEQYVNECINLNNKMKIPIQNNILQVENNEKGKKNKKFLLETPINSNLNTINSINENESVNINLNIKEGKNNLTSEKNINNLEKSSINQNSIINENNNNNNNNNDNNNINNNIPFTDSGFNQNMESKLENSTLLNPLNSSQNQNLSLEYYVEKSMNFSHNSSQLNLDESFDFH
jgi:hypothetical protein